MYLTVLLYILNQEYGYQGYERRGTVRGMTQDGQPLNFHSVWTKALLRDSHTKVPVLHLSVILAKISRL
jgi:hypothetical protein